MKLAMNSSGLSIKNVGNWAVINLVAAGPLLVTPSASGQCEVAELVASDPAAWAFFGHSVATSLDGQYIVAGANQDNENGAAAGAAYVFLANGQDWTEQIKLLPLDGEAGDRFGGSVVLSPDATLAAIAATRNNDGAGAVYVFERGRLSWKEVDKLVALDPGANVFMGGSLAMSANAETIIAGASSDDQVGENMGSVYVFVRKGEKWIQQAKLTASDAQEEDRFGSDVALSADGDHLLIGARNDDDGASNAGSVYVFERVGETWTEVNKLYASIPDQNANFGAAVSLSDDGNTAIIGARNEGAAGGAYIFVRWGEAWIEQAHLLPPPGGGGFFGSAVSMSADGNTVMVSAAEEFARGAAYVFTRQGERWSEPTRLAACDTGIDDQFATAVALSGDATVALAGAIWHEEIFPSQGAVYVFDLAMEPCYGDLSCDGEVSTLDLLILLLFWGPCDNCYLDCPDFTGDCEVGAADLLILLANWG